MMNRFVHTILAFLCVSLVFGQERGADATIISDSDRSVEESSRISVRPRMIDTTLSAPTVRYPFLALKAATSFEVDEIQPATLRHRPQLSKLYNGYVKAGGGNRLMGLGEVYYNSLRSRRMNWGVHAKHLSEWGQISDYAPSMYDRSSIKGFIDMDERRYSYGGQINYMNQGLHYYGFQDPDASRDSIRQRFNSVGFSGYYASHKKDTNVLNYRVGLAYNYFTDRSPEEDTLSAWRARENYVSVTSNWQYNSSNNVFLSNLNADLDFHYNDYRYGVQGDSINPLDTGIVSSNTVVQFRPMSYLYGKGEKLQAHLGLELTMNFHWDNSAYIFPIAEVRYSLFDDLFIPYAKLDGGLQQQRFASLTRTNEFLSSNIFLDNMQQYNFSFGIKGTLSKHMSFNVFGSLSQNNNMALFVNDTLNSSGNQFRVVYDDVSFFKMGGSLSYQKDETLKIDAVANYYNYSPSNFPHAWNLPELEFILRGKYNIVDKLFLSLDFTLETGRTARAFDASLSNVTDHGDFLSTPLGVIADANLGAEYRYSKRMSFFLNFNNFAAQRYQRWFDYPVQGFQFMIGASFRF